MDNLGGMKKGEAILNRFLRWVCYYIEDEIWYVGDSRGSPAVNSKLVEVFGEDS